MKISFRTIIAAGSAVIALSGAWIAVSTLKIRPAFLNEVYAADRKIASTHIFDIKRIGGDLYSNMIIRKRYELLDLKQYRNRKLRELDNTGDPLAEVHPSIERDIIGMEEQLKLLRVKRNDLRGRK